MSANKLKREIGPVGVIALVVSGMIGSGWLFAPLLVAQLAGPAAIIAWIIGAFAMLLLALTFGEISAMFPLPGGIASIPQVTHGNVVSVAMGWTAWLGYLLTAPLEVEATLRYLSGSAPWLYQGDSIEDLSTAGSFVALGFMAFFVVLNALGVKLFTYVNTGVTWIKVIVPIVIAVVIMSTSFEPANFVDQGGFAPSGLAGILGAISSGGVILSMIGFRHAIDMAGEVRNPGRTIPMALITAMLICLAIYLSLQIAFVGALPADSLTNGWAALHFTHQGGPLASLATAVGLLWLVSLMNMTAVLSPFGGALVAFGANARLVMAMTGTRFMPKIFASLSRYGVPLYALLLNMVLGWIAVWFLPFSELVSVHSSLVMLSFIVGPVAVVALRTLAADYSRPFRLPCVTLVGYMTFVLSTLIVFWSGWETMKVIGVAMIVGIILFIIRLPGMGRHELHLRQAAWLLPYAVGMGLVSYLGDFGGIGLLGSGVDVFLCIVIAVATFRYAVRTTLSQTHFDNRTRDVLEEAGIDKAVLDNIEI